MVVSNVFGLLLPFKHSLLQLVSLNLQLALQYGMESLLRHLAKASIVLKCVIYAVFDSEQHRSVQRFVVVFAEINILRMTSKAS